MEEAVQRPPVEIATQNSRPGLALALALLAIAQMAVWFVASAVS